MLTVVATPIGNLQDISFRAIEVLRGCDLILCEDTRHSARLLDFYEISTPTKSHHQFNEAKELSPILQRLKSGQHICLISDAGTPTISDPGARLVRACIAENIKVDSIPGACAAVLAMTLSGLEDDRFQFIGFLPKKETALRKDFFHLLHYSGTSICYISPKRLINTLTLINEIDPSRQLVVARELTKTHQEIVRGTAEELINSFEERNVKGEIVLLIGNNPSFIQSHWQKLPLEETLEELATTYHLSRMEAIKLLASLREESKRSIYEQTTK